MKPAQTVVPAVTRASGIVLVLSNPTMKRKKRGSPPSSLGFTQLVDSVHLSGPGITLPRVSTDTELKKRGRVLEDVPCEEIPHVLEHLIPSHSHKRGNEPGFP